MAGLGNRRYSFSLFTFIIFPLLLASLFVGSFTPSANTGTLAFQNEQFVEAAAMTKYIVTLKPNAPQEEYEKAKKAAINEGGKIVDEYTLIKGFVVEYPADHVSTLATNPDLNFEQDGVVTTQ